MITRETIIAILKEPQPAVPAPEVPRRIARTLVQPRGHALVLTGVRRCGKSTLLGQLLRSHPSSVSLNLEDTRLYGLTPGHFPLVLECLEEFPRATIGLDEVQEVPEWPRLVRALLDRGRRVLLTGSNASLLGREIGTRLTGRHLSAEVTPFGYAEYLAWARRPASATSLEEWLSLGGFPGYLRERQDGILRELLRDVIARDIASRRGLREIRHVMNLCLHLFANTGQPVSLHRLTRVLNLPAVAQAARAVEYLQDAYLLFALPRFSPSFRKRVVAPPKYYAVDNGLRRVNSPQDTPDLGRRLENAVYLALRARGGGVTWAGEADRWECDFVSPELALQVCLQLTPENRDREVRGVVQASRLPGAGSRHAVIVTLDQTDRLVVEGVPIHVVPAWRWLIESGTDAPRHG